MEGGKPENPEKNPRSKDENQQQTQPTYDVESGNQTRATSVGGKYSHHCAIPAPPIPDVKVPRAAKKKRKKERRPTIFFTSVTPVALQYTTRALGSILQYEKDSAKS